MTKPKFWCLKVKGSLSTEDAQVAIADREGTLLRVHSENGETEIYFSSTAGKSPEKKGAMKDQAVSLKEVSLAQVTKIR
jgi:hypothetical protein